MRRAIISSAAVCVTALHLHVDFWGHVINGTYFLRIHAVCLLRAFDLDLTPRQTTKGSLRPTPSCWRKRSNEGYPTRFAV